MIIKGKTVRFVKPSGLGAAELLIAQMGLVQFGDAVEGAPIALADMLEGRGTEPRPSPRLIRNVLERPDIIFVTLSTDNFFALRLCEMRHLFQLPAAIVVQSRSSYLESHEATPFF